MNEDHAKEDESDKTANENTSARKGALGGARAAAPRSEANPEPEEIARAAIRVADAEGLDAVSMQRLAREVKVTTMALYRYFASKDELVDRMIELAGDRPTRRDAARFGWRERLTEWAQGCLGIYHRHAWFLQAATARRRVMGPNELEWLDAALEPLHDAGLTGRQQMEAFLVLIGHVRSHAEFSAGEAKGISAEQWVHTTTELAREHHDRYKHLLGAIEAGAFEPARKDRFAFGLECILEGIEAFVGRKQVSRRPKRKRPK